MQHKAPDNVCNSFKYLSPRGKRYVEASPEDRYYLELASAFVRGKLGSSSNDPEIFAKKLHDLTVSEQRALFNLGSQAGLKLHKFKRTMELPRVQRVLGILKGLSPGNLLDIGSGRGVFVWPLLTEFSDLEVTCVDLRSDRVEDLLAVHNGGIQRLTAKKMDACALEFADSSFDVVTILEVMEHMQNAQLALNEAVRVCKRNVIISVPSSEDDNPEHIHVLDRKRLQAMVTEAGARARFQGVLNHTVVVATKYRA